MTIEKRRRQVNAVYCLFCTLPPTPYTRKYGFPMYIVPCSEPMGRTVVACAADVACWRRRTQLGLMTSGVDGRTHEPPQ